MTPRTKLGSTQLAVSRLALGTAQLGNLYREVTDAEAAETLSEATQLGINYFDTAPHYGLGLSERRLGRYLSGVNRADVIVSTKVGRLIRPNPAFDGRDDTEGFAVPAENLRVRDYSFDGTYRSLEESLERMGTDYVDVVFVHDPDDFEGEAVEGAFPALERMRSEGMIASFGAGMNQSAMLARFIERFDIDVVMVASKFSLLDQGALEDLLPIALSRGVSVVVAGVFNSGILATDEPHRGSNYNYQQAPPALVDRAQELSAVARDNGFSLPQIAAQFPLVHPAVAVVCLGARSAAQCRRNAELFEHEVPREFYHGLAAAGLINPESVAY